MHLNGRNFYSGVVWRSLSYSKTKGDLIVSSNEVRTSIHGTNARVAFEKPQAPTRVNARFFSVSCVSCNDQKANVNSRSTGVYWRGMCRIAAAISLGWYKSFYVTTYRHRDLRFAAFFRPRGGMLRNRQIPNCAASHQISVSSTGSIFSQRSGCNRFRFADASFISSRVHDLIPHPWSKYFRSNAVNSRACSITCNACALALINATKHARKSTKCH